MCRFVYSLSLPRNFSVIPLAVVSPIANTVCVNKLGTLSNGIAFATSGKEFIATILTQP
jgi:hypothetical protein